MSDDRVNQVLELLHFGFRGVTAEPDRLLARQGMGRAHHRVLFFVGRNPGKPVGDLAGILRISRQALHRPLSRLIAKGYIHAQAATGNRRIQLLTLTPKGIAFEDGLSGLQRASFRAAFAAAGSASEGKWRAVMAHLASAEPRGTLD
jgi:DNA-binding MarR family transcriptional regulator